MSLPIAIPYAINCHDTVNHLYDGQPYAVHLALVASFAYKYKHHITANDFETVLEACWCHDLIEDTRETYNDVKGQISLHAADIVYALTNEKGKNRAERANEKYYAGIRDTKYAVFVKLCDRLANVSYSKARYGMKRSKILGAYIHEQNHFIVNLFPNVIYYRDMVQHLDELLEIDENR